MIQIEPNHSLKELRRQAKELAVRYYDLAGSRSA
jgi:hypothetical protein